MFESHWLLRAVVPGQVTFDNAMTAAENGNYKAAAALGAAVVGEQFMTVASMGATSAASPTANAISTAVSSNAEVAVNAASATAAAARSENAVARMAGALVTRAGEVFTGLSNKGGAMFARNPQVDAAVATAKAELGDAAPGWAGHCCELNVAAQALNSGAEVRGATVAAVEVATGTLRQACPVCAIAMEKLGIRTVK